MTISIPEDCFNISKQCTPGHTLMKYHNWQIVKMLISLCLYVAALLLGLCLLLMICKSHCSEMAKWYHMLTILFCRMTPKSYWVPLNSYSPPTYFSAYWFDPSQVPWNVKSAEMAIQTSAQQRQLWSLKVKNNTEKPANLCSLVMIFAEHMQLHCQGNSKHSLPKLDSKTDLSCSDCLIKWLSPHQEHEQCTSSDCLRSTLSWTLQEITIPAFTR